MGSFDQTKSVDVRPAGMTALTGRADSVSISGKHFVSGRVIKPPFPTEIRTAVFGLGCFWGAERIFWQLEGVWVTAVGYAGGTTPNPTYQEVCSGRTGHTEAVLVAYDPAIIDYGSLLKAFFESHDPTQGMRQGNDVGSQYRSAVFVSGTEEREAAELAADRYAAALQARGFGPITTEIAMAGAFYYAEEYHQQYLAKNPDGYCGLGGTGVTCPAPQATEAAQT